jgi:hypothetical protein
LAGICKISLIHLQSAFHPQSAFYTPSLHFVPSPVCSPQIILTANDTENPVLISCTGNITTTLNEEQTVSKKNTASQSLLMENLVKPHKCCHNNDEAIIKGKVESFLESIPKQN